MTEESPQEGQVVKIPPAKFIENVEDFLAGRDPEEAMGVLNQNYQIYKSVEQQLLQRKTRMLSKVPDLKKAIEMVKMLIEKDGEEIKVDYSLAEQIHATAKLKDVKHVKLWLGADIMLEYELEEARTTLEENLQTAEQTSDKLTKDLELMKDYITITEVSLARLFNFDVARRRKSDKPSL